MAIADLQKTNKVLRQLDRNKLEFIQVAAHELRTPLTVLKGYLDVLNAFPEIKANPALKEVIEGLLRGSERMHEVVNLMLDVTRIDADTLKLSPAPILIRSLIDDLAAELKPIAAERHMTLTTHHAADLPRLNGDPALIHKALYHLLVNAIKYTPNGGQVEVSTRPITLPNQKAGVEIMVRDTGIGLDPEQHELIFEKFYQVSGVALHSSSKTNFKGGGPGLGLAIVRGVARAHGGKVWVESPGCDEEKCPGSTFYLQLPVNPPVKP
jgi:signal transduction histidine kinase